MGEFLGVHQVFIEAGVVPGPVGPLEALVFRVSLGGAGLASDNAGQGGPDLVLAGVGRVARLAFLEDLFSFGGVAGGQHRTTGQGHDGG